MRRVVEVVAHLVEQRGDVRVVQPVEDRAAVAARGHEAQVAQDPQLLRGGRRRHLGALGELVDARLAVAQRVQEPHARRRRQGLHQLGDRDGLGVADDARPAEPSVLCALRHSRALYPHSYADDQELAAAALFHVP